MARLTDRELRALQESRVDLRQAGAGQAMAGPIVKEPANHDTVQLSKSEGAWLGYGSLLGSLLKGISNYLERRRTISELEALDNHMLSDIGLERGDIVRFVNDEFDGGQSKGQSGPFAGLRQWFLRRQTIRELQALDDRMLADIGVQRSMIPAFVDEHFKTQAIVGTGVQVEEHAARTPKDPLRELGYRADNFDWARVVPQATAGSKTAA